MAVKISVYGTADMKQIERARGELEKLEAAARQRAGGIAGAFAQISATLDSAGGRMTSAGQTLTRNVSLPIVGIGAAAVAMATQFNEGMANVGTLIPGNVERVDELKTSVQDMAIAVGGSTTDLSDGLYQTISAFGDTSDTVAILDVNARAAAAGVAATTDAINLTSGVTKAYGDTSQAAVQKAADLALMTVRLGQTTFPELAASMGSVTPIAQAMGVSQEDLFATFATLTGVTGSAAEVSTQYRGVLAALSNPTKDLSALLEQQGYASGQAALDQLGLVGTMQMITGTAEKTGEPLAKYIASVEAQPAALALAGAQADVYNEKLAAMGDVAGTTDAAFNEIADGTNKAGFEMQQAQAKAQVLLQRLGEGLGPALLTVLDAAEPVIEAIIDLATQFAEADPEQQKMIAGAAALVAALGPVLVVAGTVTRGVASVASGISTAATVTGRAVGGLRNFATGLSNANAGASAFATPMMRAGGAIRSGASAVGSMVANLGRQSVALTISAGRWVAETVAKGAATAATIAHSAATKAAAAGQWLLNAAMSANPIGIIILLVAGLVAAIIWLWNSNEEFRNAVIAIWEAIASFFVDVWTNITRWFEEAWNNIVAFFTTAFQIYVGMWRLVLTTIFTAVSTVWNSITGFFTTAWNNIVAFFTTAFQAYVGMWRLIFTTIVNVVTTVFTNVRNTVTSIWNNITGFFTGAFATLRALFNNGLAAVRTIVSTVFGFISGLVGRVWTALQVGFRNIATIGRDIVTGIRNGISNGWSSLVRWFTGLIDGLVGGVKDLLGISSPSKVFTGIGGDMGEGMRVGLDRTIDKVRAAARGVAAAATITAAATIGVSAASASAGPDLGPSLTSPAATPTTTITIAEGAVQVTVGSDAQAATVGPAVEVALNRLIQEISAR